jgi:hypothetical protein
MFCAYLITLKSGDFSDAKKFKEVTFDTDKFYRKPINQSLKIWSAPDVDGWSVLVFQFFSDLQVRYVACAFKKEGAAIEYLERFRNAARRESEIAAESKEDWNAVYTVIGKAVGRAGEFDKPPMKSKLIWLRGNLDNQTFVASQFLRGSNSLRNENFVQINQSSFASDAKGVALVDASNDSEERCYNLLSVLALSCAYQAVLNDAIDSLAAVGSKINGRAEYEIRRWSAFLASYYFIEPVRASTIELIDFYQSIQKRQRISAQYAEVTEQLKIVAELAHIERAEAETSKTSKRSFRITLLGVVIAAASITQCTPKAWNDFKSAWYCSLLDQGCPPPPQTSELSPAKRDVQSTKKTTNKAPK